MKFDVHFENHRAIIDAALATAKTEVLIAVAWINFKEYYRIFDKLLDRKVKLHIVCSDNRANRSHQVEIDLLTQKNAKIRLLKMPNDRNHMHHKFAIIDRHDIINGSFNWSPNATRSFENILVLKDCPSEAHQFVAEFHKLWLVKMNSIRALQKKHKCKEKGCSGETFNILVFSDRASDYYELTGDIVNVCDGCGQYHTVKSHLVNNQLPILLENYQPSSESEELDLDLSIAEELAQYINEDDIVHGIGRVERGLNGRDEDTLKTNIIWKNVFVGNRLPEEFDDVSFDVAYDNSYEI